MHLLNGRGYEPTELDILSAYTHLMAAAGKCGLTEWAKSEVQTLTTGGAAPGAEVMLNALTAHILRNRQE